MMVEEVEDMAVDKAGILHGVWAFPGVCVPAVAQKDAA